MTSHELKIARVQQTLRWLEDDFPLLAIRVKDLSQERQMLAKRFAASMIDHTRAELARLQRERPAGVEDQHREPAD